MKKRFFALILFLILSMANNALSAENGEPEGVINQPHHPPMRPVHAEEVPNNPCPSLSDFLPGRPWFRTYVRAQNLLLLGSFACMHYLINTVEELKCYPAIHSPGFDNFNAAYHVNLPPSSILGHMGANVQGPEWSGLDEAYKLNEQFLLNLTSSSLNSTHVLCQYAASWYPDIPLTLTYNRNPYLPWVLTIGYACGGLLNHMFW